MIIIIEKSLKKIWEKTEFFFHFFNFFLKNPFFGEVYLSFLGSTIRLARAVRGVNSAD